MARNVIFNQHRCKGCGLCITVCPKKNIETAHDITNHKGYHPVRLKDHGKCITCGFCAVICPDVAIRIKK